MNRPDEATPDLSPQKRAELKVLRRFVEVYCHAHHQPPAGEALCADCAELLAYGRARLEKCHYDPKPSFKKCPVHCYRPDMRARIREVMKFSGLYFIKRGRLDWVYRYFARPSSPRRRAAERAEGTDRTKKEGLSASTPKPG